MYKMVKVTGLNYYVLQSNSHCDVQYGPQSFPTGHTDLFTRDRELYVELKKYVDKLIFVIFLFYGKLLGFFKSSAVQ